MSKNPPLFTLTRAALLALAAAFASAGCGKSSASDDGAGANDAGSGGAGAGAASAGSPGLAGMPSAGAAGSHSAGAGSLGGAAGAASAGAAGMNPSAGGPASTLDCDPRKIVCKRVAPDCAGDQVPSVEGACYGPCVDIDRCACTEAQACPEPERFTCHMNRKLCGPYLR